MNVTASRIAEREQVDQRLREDGPGDDRQQRGWCEPSSRRVSTTTRVGSPIRPGNTAEAITPIIVARTTGGQRNRRVRASAARSVCCQETERSTSDSGHQRQRQRDPSRAGGDQGVADALRFSRESANATSPASSDRRQQHAQRI